MNANPLSTALLAISLACPLAAQSQTSQGTGASDSNAPAASAPAGSGANRSTNQQYDAGGSKRCDAMTGAERDQCLHDEGTKTDSRAEPGSAASGGDAPKPDRGTPATPAAGSPAGD